MPYAAFAAGCTTSWRTVRAATPVAAAAAAKVGVRDGRGAAGGVAGSVIHRG
jgi:hypothetical protein